MKPIVGMLVIFVALTGHLRAADVTKVPAYDLFVVIPLRVHVLTSKTLDLFDGQTGDDEVIKAVPKINAIWSKAGISFGLESIVREPAAQLDRFQTLVQLNNGQFEGVDVFAYLLTTPSRVFDGLHVYLFHDLPINGAYLIGADATIVKEKPELKQVKGGSDNPLARVAARGLGQALGLAVREDQVGLLSPGTNGVGLSESEVGRARQVAKTIPGALEVDDAAKEAEAASKKGEVDQARRLWTWLAEVLGRVRVLPRPRSNLEPCRRPRRSELGRLPVRNADGPSRPPTGSDKLGGEDLSPR